MSNGLAMPTQAGIRFESVGFGFKPGMTKSFIGVFRHDQGSASFATDVGSVTLKKA